MDRAKFGVSWRDRDKSCLERVLYEDRRRRNRPETLRHTNGRLSRSLESDCCASGHPPKGSSAFLARDLSGLKDRGAMHTGACVSILLPRGCDGPEDRAL